MPSFIFAKNMNYVIDNRSLLYVDGILIDKTINKYLFDLSIPHFKNIKSMRDTVRENLNIKRNIPLYISKDVLIVPIKTKNITYYINFSNVKETITKESITTFIFYDKSYINLNISKRIIERIIKNIEKVYDYISLIE